MIDPRRLVFHFNVVRFIGESQHQSDPVRVMDGSFPLSSRVCVVWCVWVHRFSLWRKGVFVCVCIAPASLRIPTRQRMRRERKRSHGKPYDLKWNQHVGEGSLIFKNREPTTHSSCYIVFLHFASFLCWFIYLFALLP